MCRYDQQIKAAWYRYSPDTSWHVGWAQIKQESAFRTDAVSPVGATGLAQFMPGTWEDMKRASVVPVYAHPRDARHAIQAQAFYMARLMRVWSSPRSDADRLRLALGSYNAGAGHLIKAQRLCGGSVEYDAITQCLPDVTGRHAQETLGYVPAIERHSVQRWGRLTW